MKIEEISQEELNEAGKFTELSYWMMDYADKIFAKAPNNELYAVGIWGEEKPEIHYFNDKNKEVLPFMMKCNRERKVNNFIYRHESDSILMLMAS